MSCLISFSLCWYIGWLYLTHVSYTVAEQDFKAGGGGVYRGKALCWVAAEKQQTNHDFRSDKRKQNPIPLFFFYFILYQIAVFIDCMQDALIPKDSNLIWLLLTIAIQYNKTEIYTEKMRFDSIVDSLR